MADIPEDNPDAIAAGDPRSDEGVQQPPTSFMGTFRKLGPGLVIAASIVGSGELIATTKTGAQAGLTLLWLIMIGCVVKVFAQIELGRYSITHGQTTLTALNQLPGRIGPVHFILWFFLIMLTTSTLQLGGIVGGVGQSLSISFPITGDYKAAIEIPSPTELAWFQKWEDDLSGPRAEFRKQSADEQQRIERGHARLKEQIQKSGETGTKALETVRSGAKQVDPWTLDDRIWAGIVTALTIALLYSGSYGLLQTFATILVVGFTIATIGNVLALQTTRDWSFTADEFIRGLSFHLPQGDDGWSSLMTAIATFGIIGVGAMELLVYPYWCIEKGYARYTGRRSPDAAWAQRARGWMRVMHWDAFLSLLVYTLATMAFYVMGAAVLYREGRDPEGLRMVSTLASAYVPIFGESAKWLFLLGAVAVLYSTFLVASAGNARLFVDFLKISGAIDKHSEKVNNRWVTILCVLLPLFAFTMFALGADPVLAVLISGFMQAIMLPMIGFGTLYFRYTATDPRLKPHWTWDAALIMSFIAFVITGAWGVTSQVMSLIGK
ncbi:Nramp family divalent metal transporter [Planctomicrobium sp. SH668]|uniref:Nramp family divalent metal transporter n=1 Tax=Planctomicrobium sp. SH668 TaxID=3448126 RepID=UPI003F5B3C9D